MIIILLMAAGSTGCTAGMNIIEGKTDSEIREWVTEKLIENYGGGRVTASDIVIEKIFYGSFSREDASEALVMCKIRNSSYEEFDQEACVIFETGTWKMVSCNFFRADDTPKRRYKESIWRTYYECIDRGGRQIDCKSD